MANIIGTPLSEFLTGTPDADTIQALQGEDTVLGQEGNDLINGNQNNDVLNGNRGDDTLRGGADNDLIYGGQENDLLYGDKGTDTLFGNKGIDTIFGFEGNDVINGNENDDVINGNQGNDTVRGGRDNDLINGGQENDLLYADKGNDTAFGDKGTDTIYGFEGNDLINGNQGNDLLSGEKGNDTVRGGKADDLIWGGKDNDELHGDLGNDTLFGHLDNDTLFGEDGTDILTANQGNDAVFGNMGNDTAYGGQGNDTVRGGMQNDSLFGDKGNDTLYGDLGDDTIFGGADTDLIFGDQGAETNFGGNGKDVLFGNEGDDTIIGLGGNDLIFGNQGDDFLNGTMGNDTLYGGQENDTVRGGMQNDVLFGDKGSDVLYGDIGADTLTGDIVGDTISDIFVVGRIGTIPGITSKTTGGVKREDADLITDFQRCTDLISLTGGLTYNDISIFQGIGADAANTIILDKGTGEFLAVLQGFNSEFIDGTSFIPAGPPTVRIRPNDALASEPSLGNVVDTAEFIVTTPCPVDTALPVSYTISGTATTGKDYNPLSGVVIIPAGSNTATIPVIPLADTLGGEGNETVTLTLLPTGTYNVAAPNNIATATIADGPVVLPNTKPTVIISAINPNTSETGGTPGRFQVARTGGDPALFAQPLVVRYTVTGTANPGGGANSDYGALSGVVTIPGGQATATFDVTAQGDSLSEPTETVVATVAEDPAYIVGAADTDTVRIQDNNPLTGTGTGPILRYSSSGSFVANHNNFTEAVAAAADNDIIVARAGSYTEPGPVTINKPLTLRGPNAGISPASGFSVAPATVTTTGSGLGNPIFVINPGLSNVTIEGLTIQVQGDNGIRQQAGSTNLTIRQNEFTGNGPANGGVIYLDFNGSGSGANVSDNLIRDLTPGVVTSGIQLFRINGLRATDNQIANVSGPGIVADALTGTNNIISNNMVDNISQQGIQLAGGNARIENNDITNANTASGATDGGIRLRDSGLTSATLGTVDVFSNTVTNSFNGVAIRPGSTIPSTVRINFNNLVANSNAGLLHEGTGALNAENNWWDNPSGPVVGVTGPNAIAGASANQVSFAPFSPTPF